MIASATFARAQNRTAQGTSAEWLTPARFALALGIILAAAFPEILTGQKSLVYRDFGVFGYPVASYHKECFWRGEIPLWNPLNSSGMPFLAQWNTLTLYPLSLIYLLLPMPWSLNMFCIFHLFLGGMGMFFLATRWTGCRTAAAFAGLSFALSGLLMGSLMWPNTISVFGWVPWVVLTACQGWKLGGQRILSAAIVGAMQMLAGMPELILCTWLLIAGLWLVERPNLKTFARLASIAGLIAGLTAVQLLPFLEFFLQSRRNTVFEANVWPMPISGWANFFVPLFGASRTPQGAFVQPNQGMYSSYYVGVVVILLAVCAPIWVRQRSVRLLAMVTLVAIWLAMGDAGGLYALLVKVCPALKFMRFPVKFLAITAFTLPLLAAYATAHWIKSVRSVRSPQTFAMLAMVVLALVLIASLLAYIRPNAASKGLWSVVSANGLWRALFLIVSVGALVALKWRPSSSRVQFLGSIALLTAITLDSQTHIPSQNPTVSPAAFSPRMLAGRIGASSVPEGGRFMTGRKTYEFIYGSMLPDTFQDYVGRRCTLFANCNLIENVASPDGFFSLYVLRQMLLWENIYFAPADRFPEGLADFLAITHRTSDTDPLLWTTRTNAMPLVSIGQTPIFRNDSYPLAELMDPAFDPRKVVYLPLEAQSAVTATNATSARILSQQIRAHKIELQVEANDPAFVVVSQSHYRPWRAYVGGKPAKIWRANYAFQAVQVPAGQHKLEFVYRDEMFHVGGVLSCATLCGVALGFYRSRKRVLAQISSQPIQQET